MTINVGDKIPSVTLKQLTPEGVKEFTTDEIFRGKKVILFAVPGAFTPACSQRHLPGYVDKAANLKSKGVDEIACVAVNDAFVMAAWGKEQKTEGKVRMLADGSGDFATVQGAVDFIPGGNTNPVVVNIRNGTYIEVVRVNSKHNVTFTGQSRRQVIVAYPNNNNINPSTTEAAALALI